MFAEIGNTVMESSQGTGISWLWWVVIGVGAVGGVLYGIGSRVNVGLSKVFSKRLSEDLEDLLKKYVKRPHEELRSMIQAMWNQHPGVNFGPDVDRIELLLEQEGKDNVACAMRVVSVDGQSLTAKRVYSWDYLPTSISKILIAAKDGKDVRVLYVKK